MARPNAVPVPGLRSKPSLRPARSCISTTQATPVIHPFHGVTPDIQWEVIYPAQEGVKGGRVDILFYDRTSPEAPIELVDAKRIDYDSGAAVKANDQLIQYLQAFPGGPLDREVRRFNLGNYSDEFSVVIQSCQEGASERVVRDYVAFPYKSPVESSSLIMSAPVSPTAEIQM